MGAAADCLSKLHATEFVLIFKSQPLVNGTTLRRRIQANRGTAVQHIHGVVTKPRSNSLTADCWIDQHHAHPGEAVLVVDCRNRADNLAIADRGPAPMRTQAQE